MNYEELTLKSLRDNYYRDYDNNDLVTLFKYITSHESFFSFEYIFLCWLVSHKGFNFEINLPFFPVCKFSSFSSVKSQFVTSDKRVFLFNKLISLLDTLKLKFPVSYIVSLGGSFVDNKENPTDIDAVILVPSDLYKNNSGSVFKDNTYKYLIEFGSFMDVWFLPVDFSLSHFKAYFDFVFLGNIAEIKAKENKLHRINHFTKRSVIQFSY